MKKTFYSYTSFTRTERIGLMCLSALLILLIICRATMSLWVHPNINTEQQKKLMAAWETYKRSQPTKNTDGQSIQKKEFQDATDEQSTTLPDTININTADSAILVRLKGIGPVTAHKIIERRTTKPFTNINQLSETGSFSKTMLQLLKKHIIFTNTTN